MVLALTIFTGCTEDEGTEPGHDGTPVATLYQYTASGEDMTENDCLFRIATNAAVREVYYMAELKTAKEERNMSDDQYAELVVTQGTKVEINASDTKEVIIKDLHGVYDITVVAVNGGSRTAQTITFAGPDYKPFGTGTYTSDLFGNIGKVDIEYSAIGNRYRIVSIWAANHGFSFSPDGTSVTVFPSQMETGFNDKNHGMVSVTDQGSSYDEAAKTFTFLFKFSAEDGYVYGVGNETLVMD